jgi:hypothetical protein
MSYGVKYHTTFIAGKHKKVDKTWNDDEQEYKAGNQMEWFLKEVRRWPGWIIVHC